MIMRGKLDFCFTRSPLHHKALKYEPFFTEEILFSLPANHPVCKQYPPCEQNPYPTIDISDFKNSNFVMVNNARITPLCYKICENSSYRPNVSMQPVSWEHVIMGIRTGRGVGFISNLHMKKDDNNDLRFFHINSDLSKLELVVAYLSSYDLSPDARTFINSFRVYVQNRLASI
jgi:DNA-binding transcriptional LysR family regulator